MKLKRLLNEYMSRSISILNHAPASAAHVFLHTCGEPTVTTTITTTTTTKRWRKSEVVFDARCCQVLQLQLVFDKYRVAHLKLLISFSHLNEKRARDI